MVSEGMKELVKSSSAIRAMFEDGKKLAKEFGAENVYDFSLGNPSVKPPEHVKQAIIDVLNEEDPNLVHGYMSNAGFEDVREAIAEDINRKYGTHYNENNIVMTVGAAGGLTVALKTLLNPGDEVVAFAPFFGEYRNYTAVSQGKLIVVSADKETFLPNLLEMEEKITKKTKAVIINNPNNPTGVVYPVELIEKLAAILEKKQKEFGTDIYLISDEPYRELVYGKMEVPYLTKYYDNTIVGYSFSKTLSMPGDRIGYLVVPNEIADYENIFDALGVAVRIMGFVNAPSLMQRVIKRCIGKPIVDISIYDKNRVRLLEKLTEYGYEIVKPSGAFYLFIKTFGDDKEFVDRAKKEFHIIMSPGSAFGCPGYARLAYCVDFEMIERSLPAFEKLANAYK